ncbi:unnamed protein product [Cylindrotheca closterium]|uniref:HMG box domain-containing protein n=1 Tax=Cylindrotheca closterium TaxID=2856 RepID=A0AAD2CKS4_9STRA|nr:unnamed protein product [Cylindrotheca closterium]
MYNQLLASKRKFDGQNPEVQNLLSLSIVQQNDGSRISGSYNLHNNTSSSNASNHLEMNGGDFRSRQGQQGEASEDYEPYTSTNVNDNHDSDDPLFSAPIRQIIDDYDGDMDASRSPAKRAKLQHQQEHSGGRLTPPPSPPNSAFVFFFRIQRENLLEKAKTGGTKFQNTQQVVQEIEKEWGLLAMDERRVYEQLAANDEKRYQREIEEYQNKRQQHHQQQQHQQQHQHQHQYQQLSNQGEQASRNNFQTMLLAGLLPGQVSTATATQLQVNAIARLRSPFPTAAATVSSATNVAPSYHHFMPPTQAVVNASNATFPNSNTITPPQNPPSVSAPPPTTLRMTNGTIVLPPSQSSIPLPAGMEIELSGRMYKVGYQCQLMTREEAQKYVKPYTAAQSELFNMQQQQQQQQQQPPLPSP